MSLYLRLLTKQLLQTHLVPDHGGLPSTTQAKMKIRIGVLHLNDKVEHFFLSDSLVVILKGDRRQVER